MTNTLQETWPSWLLFTMSCEFSSGTELDTAPEVQQLNLHAIKPVDIVDLQSSWQCQYSHVGRPLAQAIVSFLIGDLCSSALMGHISC